MIKVNPVGRATEQECDLVRAELKKLPDAELKMLEDMGVSAIVCRDNVTTHNSSYFDNPPTG